ncbi:MAG: S26 family signal peptidase [Aureliella sp.]
MVSKRQTVKRYRDFAPLRLTERIASGSWALVASLPLLLASVPLACCCGCLGSAPAPTHFQVASSSMFPALMGPTLGATCTACQFTYPVAAETFRPELPTRCERCGGLCGVAAAIQPGQTAKLQRLSVDTLSDQNSSKHIRRWDLIAFQEPASGSTHVKRVWGLPGEAIELRDGEAWVDGKLLRKSLAELRQLAVPVYDMQRGGGGQWWSSKVNELSKSASLSLQPGQVFHFQFCRPAPVHPSEVPSDLWLEASPVVDSYSINQGLSTVLHPVDDCLLSLGLGQPFHGALTIEIRLHERVVRVELESIELSTESLGTNVAANVEPKSDSGQAVSTWRIAGQHRIDVGWCDGRLLLESDAQSRAIEADELALAFSAPDILHSANSQWGPHELFRLEASGTLVVSELRLFRDLYLVRAFGGTEHRSFPRESPERTSGFYVLGDNLPVSQDSRQHLGRVSPSQVLGRIYSDVSVPIN